MIEAQGSYYSPSIRLLSPVNNTAVVQWVDFELRCLVAGVSELQGITASAVLLLDGAESSRFEILEDGPYSMVLPEIDDGEHSLSLHLDIEARNSDSVETPINPFAPLLNDSESLPWMIRSDPPSVIFRVQIADSRDEEGGHQHPAPPAPPPTPAAAGPPPPPPPPAPAQAAASLDAAVEEAEVAYASFNFPPAGHCFVDAADVVVAIAISDGYFRSSLPSAPFTGDVPFLGCGSRLSGSLSGIEP